MRARVEELDQETATSTELLQRHLPQSNVVKGFNHIYAAELTTHGSLRGTLDRRALVLAGDDAAAKARFSALLDEFGFDAVAAGSAADSRWFEVKASGSAGTRMGSCVRRLRPRSWAAFQALRSLQVFIAARIGIDPSHRSFNQPVTKTPVRAGVSEQREIDGG